MTAATLRWVFEVFSSTVNQQRFDANPDPTFHFDVDPEPDLDPSPSVAHVGKLGKHFGQNS
jgi:hypothetical protein